MPALPPFGLLVKPVSGRCNLGCSYCFYRHQRPGDTGGGTPRTMPRDVLETLVKGYMQLVDRPSFAWQGGEPTLAGLPFFEGVLKLQDRYAKPGQRAVNSLQTNGTLLNGEWAAFLGDNGFLVGISIDGRRTDHDRYRVSPDGKPTFERVMAGLEALKAHGTETNILAVVTPEAAGNPWRTYSSLRRYGIPYLQFIPLMESPADADGKGTTLSPEAYGRFLCETFDYWYADLFGPSPVSVRTFDNAVGLAAGIPSETCVFRRGCVTSPVVEWDGSVYPCDFFVGDEWLLGNIMEEPLEAILGGEMQARFLARSMELPDDCRICPALGMCNGGCMAERDFARNVGNVSFYCESYRRFFDYAGVRLREIARRTGLIR